MNIMNGMPKLLQSKPIRIRAVVVFIRTWTELSVMAISHARGSRKDLNQLVGPNLRK